MQRVGSLASTQIMHFPLCWALIIFGLPSSFDKPWKWCCGNFCPDQSCWKAPSDWKFPESRVCRTRGKRLLYPFSWGIGTGKVVFPPFVKARILRGGPVSWGSPPNFSRGNSGEKNPLRRDD